MRPERDGVSSPEGGERRDEQSSVGLVVLLGDSATSSADAGLIDPEWSLGE